MKKTFFVLLLLHYTGIIRSNTLLVPSQYATIQSALNNATTADTVLVQPGTYLENIVWPNVNGIKLISAGDSINTIINGNNNGRVIFFNCGVTIDTATVIKGFKITGGKDDEAGFAYGGGIYCENYISPMFASLWITNNKVLTTDASIGQGGGVYCIDHCSPYFKNVLISGNLIDSVAEGDGGGIYCGYFSSANFNNVIIQSNTIKADGSSAGGGGMYCENNSNVVLSNVKVRNNLLQGTIYTSYYWGGGIYFSNGCLPILDHVEISGNQMLGSSQAFYMGGGIYSFIGCNLTMTNVLIVSNIICGNGVNFHYGGGLHFDNNSGAAMTNVTVANNHTTTNNTITGSGLWCDGGGSITIKNSIFWNNNTDVEIMLAAGSVIVDHSDIRGGWTGNANINSNPSFISVLDFHLQLSSPCLNTGILIGSPNDDIEFSVRPQPVNSNPDMGAYEMNQPLSVFSYPSDQFHLKIFPDPILSAAIIEMDGWIMNDHINFILFDMLGKEVMEQKIASEKTEISRGVLNAGIYLYKIVSDTGIIYSGKLVISEK